jgi:hypothetical protein
MRRSWHRVALLLSLFYPAVAQTTKRAAVPLKTKVPISSFKDTTNGVSFDYPAVWKLSKRSATQPFYEPPVILQPDRLPEASVTFTSAGNYYAKTNLTGLSFTYAALPDSTRESCDKVLAAISTDSSMASDAVVLNGVSFTHLAGGGAGMCHRVTYNVYGTYRYDRCLLFEADIHTLCPGVVDGTRELTAAESKALKRHLDSVMKSVRIVEPVLHQ